MWTVWPIIGLALAIFAATTVMLWPDLRAAPRGWQLLGASGTPLALGGLGFAIRFWVPTPGPYLANELYPFGTLLNAWAVSFGFMWFAFGLAFFGFAVRGRHSGRTWLTLLAAWVLAWLPHGVIGVAFAVAGSNQPSIELYREWGSKGSGFLTLAGMQCHPSGPLRSERAGFCTERSRSAASRDEAICCRLTSRCELDMSTV